MKTAQNIDSAVDLMLLNFISEKSSALCTALIPVAVSAITLYCIKTGLEIGRGTLNDPAREALWRIVRVSIIISISLNVGIYQVFIVKGLDSIAGAFLEAITGVQSFAALIDEMAEPFAILGEKLWSAATVGVLPRIALVFAAGIVSISQSILFSVGIGFYLLAKVSVALTFALGPGFLFCGISQSTAKYTENWLGQTLSYLFLKVFVSATVVMLTSFVSQYASHISETIDNVNIVEAACSLLLTTIALTITIIFHPQLATALFGGASISGAGRAAMHMLLYLLSARTPHSPAANPPNQIQRGRSIPNAHSSNQLVSASPLYSRNSLQQFHRQYSRRTA